MVFCCRLRVIESNVRCTMMRSHGRIHKYKTAAVLDTLRLIFIFFFPPLLKENLHWWEADLKVVMMSFSLITCSWLLAVVCPSAF